MTLLYRFGLTLTGLFLALSMLGQTYKAVITGRMEVPPVATLASGNLTAELDGNTLTVTGSFQNLASDFNTNIGAHLHIGFVGSNGDVALALNPTINADNRSGSFTAADNTYDLTDDQRNALIERRMYVNIHTVANPAGEIRGQLRIVGNTANLTAGLYGPNEVPPVATMGHGGVMLELRGDTLTVTGSFNDFSSPFNGGAHLHTGMAGQNGGVDIPLTATANADGVSGFFAAADNTYILDDVQKQRLLTRGYYVNLHSEGNPSGEIRGQVVGEPRAVFRSAMSGGFSVPMVNTLARGQILAELYESTVLIHGSFVGLQSPLAVNIAGGAHLHDGIAGRTGGILQPLAVTQNADNTGGTFDLASNSYNVDADFMQKLMNRGVYLNIHSENQPTGETRGQMLPESQAIMTSVMTGTQEVGDVLTRGYGQVKAEISSNGIILSGSIGNLQSDIATQIAGGMHLHRGAAGTNGPVAIPLNIMMPDSRSAVLRPRMNRFPLSEGLRDSIVQRMAYLNIHTTANMGGEVRGQFMLDAANYVIVPMGGASETNPTRTAANGMLIGELFPVRVSFAGAFQNLESDYNFDIAGGAHLHTGKAGSNGDVIFLLNSDVAADNRNGVFAVDSNVIALNMDQLMMLRSRGLYANIHSVESPAGEIRGQVLPLSRTIWHSSLKGMNEVPIVNTTGNGSIKAELRANVLVVTGSFQELSSPFNGGAHLHFGSTAENGDVTIALSAQAAADNLSGEFNAAMNTYTLTGDQMDALYNKDIYINIHTEANPAGEIRGQLVTDPNMFPSMVSISSPPDGTLVDLMGDPATPFQVSWNEATDTDNDDDELAYTWQLATDEDFGTILLMTELSDETGVNFTFADVDALLAANGLDVGESATFFHRAVTTDGSNCSPSEAVGITINRGIVSGTRDLLRASFDVSVYPTLLRNSDVTVSIDAAESTTARLLLTDLAGRVIREQPVRLSSGTQTLSMQTADLSAGTYLVNFLIDNTLVVGHKVVVQ